MLKIINPAKNEVIQELEEDTPDSISRKFEQAVVSQKQWMNKNIQKREESLLKFSEFLLQDKERLANLLSSETGKPVTQAGNEVKATTARIEYFLKNTSKVIQNEMVLSEGSLQEVISYEPLGVIANISAWNYPYFVGSNVFVPALLTGNAVLYKPSEYASLTGLAITDLLHKSGVPKEVFAPIIGGGNAGSELLKQKLNGVFFTGSYATGMKIAEATGGKIKLQLELGGKDPVYVCEDVDISVAAASLADGAFYNTGQSCCSVERIYVHQSIYDEFVGRFVKEVKSFKIGLPNEQDTYIAPLTRTPQVRFLEEQVKDAISKGAKVLTGGKKLSIESSQNYFEPTVLTGVNHTMDVMKEESFGPIIGIQKVSDDKEAIALMNDTEYGLTAGVYSQNINRAKTILSQVNSGSVYWNCCDRVSPRLPWTGRKHSGIGSTLSHLGILAFVQPKAWHLKGLT
ncbi:MAG: aldehyde dehydrogenase family protein [Leptospiraceae bacterium]|nr:aldehyde dehydrogenase family protein [Leptospiraceae bacterium]MCP5493898.1 aldehyde dehydrogenase family protein [Leptospiraceae bacterium]